LAGAGYHRALDTMGTSQQPGGFGDLAPSQQVTDPRARNDLSRLLDQSHRPHAETMCGAVCGKVRRRTQALMTKTEVLANVDEPGAQVVGQHFAAEQLGRQPGEFLVESHHDELVDAESLQQLGLSLERREHSGCGTRTQ
jgi:hypothetical protein